MKNLLLMLLAGCSESVTEFHLTKEFYEWHCEFETEDHPIDTVHVSTNTCDQDVAWIVAEMQFYDGEAMLRRLERDILSPNCEWYTYFPLINDYSCDDVEGVALTAWVN